MVPKVFEPLRFLCTFQLTLNFSLMLHVQLLLLLVVFFLSRLSALLKSEISKISVSMYMYKDLLRSSVMAGFSFVDWAVLISGHTFNEYIF